MGKLKNQSIDANDTFQINGVDGLIKQYDTQCPNKQIVHRQYTKNLVNIVDSLVNSSITIENLDELGVFIKQYSCRDILHFKNNDEIVKILPKHIAVILANYTYDLIGKNGYAIAIGVIEEINKNIQTPYIFNGKYWIIFESDELRSLLKKLLVKIGKIINYDELESDTIRLQQILVDTFVSNITNKLPLVERSFINLDNTVIEFSNGKIINHNHSSEFGFKYVLPYSYDCNLYEAPQFYNYLDKIMPDKESQRLLQEVVGWVFVPHLKLEKIPLLLGCGSNGKSVFLDIISGIFGEYNISQKSLVDLANTDREYSEKARYSLKDKKINICRELNAKKDIDHEILKTLASGEPVTARKLYKNPEVINDYALLMSNANQLPQDIEFTKGYFRRLLIIPFEVTINKDEQDINLAKKIKSCELTSILNWALDGAIRLDSQGSFSKCTKSDEALKDYELQSDKVSLFLFDSGYKESQECCNLVKATAIYNEFRQYVTDNGYRILSNQKFYERIQQLGYKITEDRTRTKFLSICKCQNKYKVM